MNYNIIQKYIVLSLLALGFMLIVVEKVKPLFEKIRYSCDKLELLVDDQLWPLIKYRELLFIR